MAGELGDVDLLKPPLVSLAVLISGLIISKVSPRPARLAAWNVFVVLVVAILFVIYIFLDCDRIQNLSLGNKEFSNLSHACNGPCNCLDSIPFSPVCAEDGSYTYFSPCHAGCRSVRQVDDIQLILNFDCVFHTDIVAQRKKGEAISCRAERTTPKRMKSCDWVRDRHVITFLLCSCFSVSVGIHSR
uniref:Kazal-like domain-containing protein n=1 Tax=Timema poppense TaxID=170557 RepID=A0A7R9D5B6_TIMPO|nr:unnamed protein product [Timema poppensis]